MVRYNTRQQPIILRGDLHLFYVSVKTKPIKQDVISYWIPIQFSNHNQTFHPSLSQLIMKKTKPAHNREHD